MRISAEKPKHRSAAYPLDTWRNQLSSPVAGADHLSTTLDVQRYRIVVAGGGREGHTAYSPDVPGISVRATTVEQCVREMRSAIAVGAERAQMRGELLPEPSGPGVTVEP